jgi:hypothetical protein
MFAEELQKDLHRRTLHFIAMPLPQALLTLP